jgi:hypothetical protein
VMSPTAASRIGRTSSTPTARSAVDDLNETAYLPGPGARMAKRNRPSRPDRASATRLPFKRSTTAARAEAKPPTVRRPPGATHVGSLVSSFNTGTRATARATPGEGPDASVDATTAAAPNASNRTPVAGNARRMTRIVTSATDGAHPSRRPWIAGVRLVSIGGRGGAATLPNARSFAGRASANLSGDGSLRLSTDLLLRGRADS